MAKFARVLVDRSGSHIFDYEIPATLEDKVQVGSRVRVPVRTRTALATVLELTDSTDATGLREILEVLGTRPLLSPLLIKLAFWVADYYCCQPEVALRCVLPEVIRHGKLGHKKQLVARLARALTAEEFARLERRAPKQAGVVEFLRETDAPVAVSKLVRACGVTRATLRQMAETGLLETAEVTVDRDPCARETFVPTAHLELNSEQRAVFEEVRLAIAASRGGAAPKPLLLHGVTGSGKTEIYLQAIELVLARGHGAIVLVPEISLTPQTVERFKSRFAGRDAEVAVLHSHLSAGERHDEWHRINEGRARIVIGARSAVFAPVRDCGLIVVDEEHENSYKQEDAPRYHARDLAVMRAHLERCAVLLGSATPSVESYQNAATGRYRLLRLAQRVDERRMPVIHVIDMRLEAQKQKGTALISDRLGEAIRLRLERREQCILFLNRRGFSTSLVCAKCGHVCSCEHCSVALTFHRSANRVVCHICGHTAVAPSHCPECRDPGIRYSGAGTEKVEETVGRLFPKAVVRRMDADSMQRKDAYRETLGAFRAGKIDILVGTQMIAKGLHFPNVTLVGIVNADVGLHLPDFRAGERTFQLLTQVAGRAGRGEVEGEVFVQSFTPFHSAIQFARHHDFDGFWEEEIGWRRQFNFPPFTHLVLLTLRAPHQHHAAFSAETLARRVREGLPPGVTLSEPAPAPLEKAHGCFRYHLMLRSRAVLQVSRHLRAVLDKLTFPEDVTVTVDVDPFQLL